MKLRFYTAIYALLGAVLRIPSNVRDTLLKLRLWAWEKSTEANLAEINKRIARRN